MRLAVWTYEGPPHVGAMRVATAMEGVHYVLHAPQGDTYADLLFTMIERRDRRPPVSYTTFQARDLGGDTAELFKRAARDAFERFRPAALLVGASCTGELIQDDPGGLARALDLPVPVIPLELPSYQRKENWGASETFYQLVRTLAAVPSGPGTMSEQPDPRSKSDGRPSCNILARRRWISPSRRRRGDHPASGAARYRDQCRGAPRRDARRSRAARCSRLQCGAVSGDRGDRRRMARAHLQAARDQDDPHWRRGHPGVHHRSGGTGRRRSRGGSRERDLAPALVQPFGRFHYLTGKRVYIFGDATHAIAAARVAAEEIGFTVVGLGTYAREFARELREAAARYGVEALITDDYLEVEARIVELQPELVLGTQMERHIAKRLGIGCAVISAPVHVQDFPARYSPQMGFEGANVIFDNWVHPLMMGLEEHLLAMFSGDAEFHGEARPSHLGAPSTPKVIPEGAERRSGNEELVRHESVSPASASPARPEDSGAPLSFVTEPILWSPEAEQEVGKIPFFVRGKARRNTEKFAAESGVALITIETLYDAKAHFGR